ncbi:DNA-deoxyinosine glycosylase [Dyella subtropica]|uniref:DNA-deoxyinosine glycosylase n=1 Tax=Dyella subtropica TaxID=2992127 RepID=UPI002259FE67|nr:DNA-deoxyinosine glycosylase [Dyella subtropica]
MTRKRSFAPVVDPHVRVLILGSLPGEMSLAQGQYYAFPQNKFWELVSSIIDVELRPLPYVTRLDTVLAHSIGLWDVIAEAERPGGSLDASIRNETHNALSDLLSRLPQLRAIGFNGGTAARHGRRQLKQQNHRLALIDLPSSSPAHTLAFERKRQAWSVLRTYLTPPEASC